MATKPMPLILALTLPLFLLGACGGKDRSQDNLTALDESLGQKDEAALRGALAGQIVVDPALASRSAAGAGGREYQAPVGGRLLRAPKATQAAPCPGCERDQQTAAAALSCAGKLQHGAEWANRLPADLPLYPTARLTEAAGMDEGKCTLRVASFVTDQPMTQVIDYYYTRAVRSGFDAEHQLMQGQHVLGGVRKGDDAAYFITFAPRKGGGTAVDIITNKGR